MKTTHVIITKFPKMLTAQRPKVILPSYHVEYQLDISLSALEGERVLINENKRNILSVENIPLKNGVVFITAYYSYRKFEGRCC